jgi:uncharacterized protein YnzC (UPF0291/DUF896 family)
MSFANKRTKKHLCKCNHCLEKHKDGCWLQKEIYDSHLRRQRYFKRINTKINSYINPILLNSDKDNGYITNFYYLII